MSTNEVTLAEIKKDIAYLSKDFTEWKKSVDKILDSHADDIEATVKETIKISERQSIWNYGLMALNVIIGAVASYLGFRRAS